MTEESNKKAWALEVLKKCVRNRYIDYTMAGFELERMTGKQWNEIVEEAKNEHRK